MNIEAIDINKRNSGLVADIKQLAEGLPDFFTESAIAEITSAVVLQELIVARKQGQLVGFLTYQEKTADEWEGTWMAVERSMRGEGIGSALLDRLFHEAARDGVKFISLLTLAPTEDEGEYAFTRKFL